MSARIVRILLMAALFNVGAAWSADAETDPAAEQREFEAEEKADAEATGDPEMAFINRQGKLTVYSKEQIEALGDATIFGAFETGGATHLVRTVGETIRKSLEKLNGKICVLNSKLRNKGKYIYVRNVVLSGPAANPKPRRGGL